MNIYCLDYHLHTLNIYLNTRGFFFNFRQNILLENNYFSKYQIFQLSLWVKTCFKVNNHSLKIMEFSYLLDNACSVFGVIFEINLENFSHLVCWYFYLLKILCHTMKSPNKILLRKSGSARLKKDYLSLIIILFPLCICLSVCVSQQRRPRPPIECSRWHCSQPCESRQVLQVYRIY